MYQPPSLRVSTNVPEVSLNLPTGNPSSSNVPEDSDSNTGPNKGLITGWFRAFCLICLTAGGIAPVAAYVTTRPSLVHAQAATPALYSSQQGKPSPLGIVRRK